MLFWQSIVAIKIYTSWKQALCKNRTTGYTSSKWVSGFTHGQRSQPKKPRNNSSEWGPPFQILRGKLVEQLGQKSWEAGGTTTRLQRGEKYQTMDSRQGNLPEVNELDPRPHSRFTTKTSGGHVIYRLEFIFCTRLFEMKRLLSVFWIILFWQCMKIDVKNIIVADTTFCQMGILAPVPQCRPHMPFLFFLQSKEMSALVVLHNPSLHVWPEWHPWWQRTPM